MKITIDTNNDSHDNIKKAIKMLQSIVGDEVMSNSPSILDMPAETSSQQTGQSIMGMFGDDASLPILNTSEQQIPENVAAPGTPEEDSANIAGTEELFADIFGESGKEEPKKEKSDIIEFY